MQYFNRIFQFPLFLCVIMILATGCESRKTIVNGLDEREANEILVFLSSRGIDATKVQAAEAGGAGAKIVLWNISVSGDQATEAMALLNAAGLPRKRSQNLLDIFANVGLVPSEMTEKIRFQAGLAEQIASTLRKIDGILDADVQISFPEEDPLNPGQKKGKITAAVYVKHNGVLDDPNSHLISRIKRLVSGSIVGLDYDNVTVIGDRARYTEAEEMNVSPEEQKNFVKIWSVIVAKDSVNRFRIIFFSFFLSILALALTLAWLIWKLLPLFKAKGMKELFSLQPLTIEKLLEESEKQEPLPKEKKPEEKKSDQEVE